MAKILTDQNFRDNVQATFGNSDDLQLVHDGSNSYIQNSTGSLIIEQSSGAIALRPKTGETGLLAVENAGVSLYYDNSKKFETTSTGISVTGDVSLPNLNSIYLGTSSALRIYTDSSVGYLRGNDVRLTNALNQSIFRVNTNSAELYYSDAKKLETTTTGIEVSGRAYFNATDANTPSSNDVSVNGYGLLGNRTTNPLYIQNYGDGGVRIATNVSLGAPGGMLVTDSLVTVDGGNILLSGTGRIQGIDTVSSGTDAANKSYVDTAVGSYLPLAGGTMTGNVRLNDNVQLQIGSSNDAYIMHNGTNTYFVNSVGNLEITNDAVDKSIMFKANESSGAEAYLGLLPSFPGVFVYKDLLLAQDGNGGKIKLGASQDLEIFHDGSNSYVQDVGTGNLVIKGSTNVLISTTGGGQMAQFTDSGSAYLYHSGSLKFYTTSSGITISGNINVSGTVDGRDVASDGSKLDGIASGATANAGTVTSVSASTATNADGLSVSSGTTTPVIGLDIVGMGDYADGFSDGSIDYSQVFVPICDDDNGGGNKKTSVKSLLEGGNDSKHQFVLNSNFSDDTSTTSMLYMPFNSLSDTTSGQYYVHWAAPCTGRIKRVIMQHVYGSMSSSFTTQLQIYKNGSTFASSNELTVSTTNDGGYIEWNPSGGNESFAKGDRIRIRYQKSATGKYWRGVAASIIMELDQV